MGEETGPLLSKLQQTLQQKEEQPTVATRATFDWKGAELTVSSQFTQPSMAAAVIALQKQALSQRIPCFYTFFVMQKALKDQSAVTAIEQQASNIVGKQSKYHSIKTFIRMREHLLSKINKFTGGQIKALFEDIDDIRFLNFEIITGIQRWKEQWRVEGEAEPVFYEGNMNFFLYSSSTVPPSTSASSAHKSFYLNHTDRNRASTGRNKEILQLD